MTKPIMIHLTDIKRDDARMRPLVAHVACPYCQKNMRTDLFSAWHPVPKCAEWTALLQEGLEAEWMTGVRSRGIIADITELGR